MERFVNLATRSGALIQSNPIPELDYGWGYLIMDWGRVFVGVVVLGGGGGDDVGSLEMCESEKERWKEEEEEDEKRNMKALKD